MLKALIFDCDGVLADSEPIHFALFRKLAEEAGVQLSKEQYLSRYLAMDDRGCFTALLKDNGRNPTKEDINKLMRRKAALYKEVAAKSLVILPGAVELVKEASKKYPLAVASGALRDEIHMVLDAAGLRSCFTAVVSAEDVQRGKPAPDAFLKAMAEINKANPKAAVTAGECLVVEDSKHGVASAKSAGMKCLAVATSYSVEELSGADKVVLRLSDVAVAELEGLF